MGNKKDKQVVSSKISQISLNFCPTNTYGNLTEMNFGDKNIEDICGNGTDNPLDNSTSSNYLDFTKFFQDHGTHDYNNGTTSDNDPGTNQCLGGESQEGGVISTQESNTKFNYLGLCSETNKSVTKFIKREKRDKK